MKNLIQQTSIKIRDKLFIFCDITLSGKLYIVGVGPGHHDHMTFRAKQVIEESDTIVGYETYVNLVEDLIDGKGTLRCAKAIQEMCKTNNS